MNKIPKEIDFLNYLPHQYYNFSKIKGYAGCAILSLYKPLSVKYGMDIEKHDRSSRLITLEFPKFFLVNVYVPTSGHNLCKLDYREEWDRDFTNYIS